MCGYKVNSQSVNTEQCSYGCLMSLGRMRDTGGAFKHEVLMELMSSLPAPVAHLLRLRRMANQK